MIPRSFGIGTREAVRRGAFAALAACVLAIGASAWWLMGVRRSLAELRAETSGRQARLSENRRVGGGVPIVAKPDALDRSRAVSKLRATLATLAAGKNVGMDEFQASTEEAPYLTSYATDNKDPGWMQVPVRLVLTGRSTAIMATVSALRNLDVPFEIDTVELTRRSTDNKGMATVAAGIGMRVLVYRGES